MSIHKMLRVVCDHCGSSTSVSTGDELKAFDMLRKRNWVFHSLSYGNELQYCNESCREIGLEKLGEPIQANRQTTVDSSEPA